MQAASSSSLIPVQPSTEALAVQLRSAEPDDPLIQAFLTPLALAGTAAVMTTAAASLYNNPATPPIATTAATPQVSAPTATAADQSCNAACRDLSTLQTQMRSQRQYIAAQENELKALRDEHGDNLQTTVQALVRRLRSAQMQQQQLAAQASQLQQELQHLTSKLGLPAEVSATEILGRVPSYQLLWQRWQQLDQQYGETAAAEALGPEVWTPLATPPNAPRPTEQLLVEHEQVSKALQAEVKQMMAQPTYTLDLRLGEAIDARPARLAYIEAWLLKAHQLQLVQSRQTTLQGLEGRLNQHQNYWWQLAQREAAFEQAIADANATLNTYTVKAQQLLNTAHGQQQAISSPEAASGGVRVY